MYLMVEYLIYVTESLGDFMPDLYRQTADLLDHLRSAQQHAQTLADPRRKPDYYAAAREAQAKTVQTLSPDLDQLLDTLPDENAPPSNLTHTASPAIEAHTPDPIGFEMWEALAYDLVLAHTDEATIAKAYQVSQVQLAHLRANPYFKKMVLSKEEEIRQLGADAAFVVKMRMVATRATPQFLKRLTDSSTNNKDFHALFKTAVELAKLLPETDDRQIAVGASVTFNIQGVPGLEHLAKPSGLMVDVIDHEELQEL